MDAELWALAGTAVTIGFLHTLLGPDHYVPFVAMSKAGGWSHRKTLIITLLSGLGHVGSSVLVGGLGIALGFAVHQLEDVEASRGGIAGWLLIGFGLAYLTWGCVYALRGQAHSHAHAHADGTVHVHPHGHSAEHLHVHEPSTKTVTARLTPWVLFTVFLFGPCEPLIPLLMFPAASRSVWGVVTITGLFALSTLLTMTVMVLLLIRGFEFARFAQLERYTHAVAGGLVLACGAAVKFGL